MLNEKSLKWFVIIDSNNLKAVADSIGKSMFNGSVGSIPVNSKQILQMILQTVDKRCGDEITKNKFHEIEDNFGQFCLSCFTVIQYDSYFYFL